MDHGYRMVVCFCYCLFCELVSIYLSVRCLLSTVDTQLNKITVNQWLTRTQRTGAGQEYTPGHPHFEQISTLIVDVILSSS